MHLEEVLDPTVTIEAPLDRELQKLSPSRRPRPTAAKDYSVFTDRERRGWADEAIVEAYVSCFGPVSDEIASLLSTRVAKPNNTLLDLCCGHGSLASMLCAAGANVVGVDFSPKMLELAQRAAPLANFQECDAKELPFLDETFDAVVCNFGMMHLPHPRRALFEVRRVLRKGGDFSTSTWAITQAPNAFGIMAAAIQAHADLALAPQQPDLFAMARPTTAEKMMADAGLAMDAHDVMTPLLRLKHPDELFTIFLTATVGVSMLIRGQPDHVINAIRRDVANVVASTFAASNGYLVPVPVAIMSATTA
jgi:2-polyprenyl-3-methyl-5-hydroxy-6-metoxy-1,4-benzoquinol methylase